MKTITAVLATAAVGAVGAGLLLPSATASKDPCTASEVARTAGGVVTSVGDYLDSHPETNQAMTSVLQQPAGPGSAATLNTYFGANPKVHSDLAALAEPLTAVAVQCRLPVGIPQVLGMMQAAQGQLGSPGGAVPPRPAPAQAPPMLVR